MKVETLAQLQKLALEKKSVTCPEFHCFSGRIPAAFAINFQGTLLLQLFNEGMYVYKRKKEDTMAWVCDKCGDISHRPYTSVSDTPCDHCKDGTYKLPLENL